MAGRGQQAPDRDRSARALRRLVGSLRSTDSYGLVLVMIVLTYVLAATLAQRWAVTVLLMVQIATVWLALRTAHAPRGIRAVAHLVAQGDSTMPYVFTAASVLYVVAPFWIVRHIAYRRAVDQETMLGALAAYLFIGMAFAFVYRFLGTVQASPFFGDQGDGTLSDNLFFSFVTLTTTGYGNLVPAGNPGQSLAVLEALMGQLFLVTAVGKLVSAWRPRGWRDASPDTESPSDRSG